MMLKTAFESSHTLIAIKDDGMSMILTNETDACDENGRALYDEYRIDIPDDPDYEYSDVTFYMLKPSQIERAYAKGYLK